VLQAITTPTRDKAQLSSTRGTILGPTGRPKRKPTRCWTTSSSRYQAALSTHSAITRYNPYPGVVEPR